MSHELRCAFVSVLFGITMAPAADAALPFLSTQGSRIVDPDGNPIVLRGCNLGNWLMLESWMLGGCIQDDGQNYHDQAHLFRTLQQRFGQERFDHLFQLYRDGYIGPRDFELIKSFGFNVARVPFDYRLLQEDQPPYSLRSNAFAWLDRAVKLADAAQVYVILDLHGAPGGQSGKDHTGESGQNHLWHNDVNKQRTIDLWTALAGHFKGNPTVAAYDLINEPYGDYHTDARPELAELIPKICAAIRATGDQHIVFFPGALNGGIAFYGDPHAHDFTNVGFTEHFYPGLFGSTPALETQARMLNQELPNRLEYLRRLGVPYFVGEFNIVLPSEYPNRIMRAYYDRFAENGWAATMWSYKLLTPHGGVDPGVWYLVTNASPLPRVDINNSSYEDFEKLFTSFATMPLAVNQPLREALTTSTPSPLLLAEYPKALTALPPGMSQADPPGWASLDIGHATPGCTRASPDGTVVIFAGGSDIHGTRDSCRFVSQAARDQADLSAQFTGFLDTHVFAKTGIMARWGEQPGAPMAMINIFPEGQIALISRSRAGAATSEIKPLIDVSQPVELRLKVQAGQASGFYRDHSGDWKTLGTAPVPDGSDFRIGIAACSHVDAALTMIKARLGAAADLDLPAPPVVDQSTAIASLLANSSFEWNGSPDDPPSGWKRWDEPIDRDPPAHDRQNDASAGLSQDLSVVPGRRYELSIWAKPTSPANQTGTLELRLENTVEGGQVTLNLRKYAISELARGDALARLSVSGTAISDKLRILLILSSDAPDLPKVDFSQITLLPRP
jgi:glucan 1,3-beta-glucosidase